MQKFFFSILMVSLACLMACPVGKLPLHAPPQYAEDGTPSDLFFEELAKRTSEMAAEGEIPSDPEKALQAALDYLKSRNIQILSKAEGFERWDKFTTTFPKQIFVSKDWNKKTVAEQAEILWHEIVHVREYDVHTPLKMGTLYIVAEGRWALEVQAYRESFRVKRLFGVSEEALQDEMAQRAKSLYMGYELGTMPQEYALSKAIEIWMLDSSL